MTTNDFRGKPMRIKCTTLIIAAAVLLAAAIGLCSCGQTYYEEMDEKGYTVSVSYDPNGGTFSSTNSVITDVFDPSKCEKDENGNAVISLVDPSSPVRDKTNPLTVAKPGYFLAGWYAERELKNPDDPDGGYIYGKKWDFENDTLVLDGDKTYTSAENVLTLYAAWIPNFEFNFYRENENGEWVKYATPATNSVIDVPEWKNGDSTIKMGRFPALTDTPSLPHMPTPSANSSSPADLLRNGTLKPRRLNPALSTFTQSGLKATVTGYIRLPISRPVPPSTDTTSFMTILILPEEAGLRSSGPVSFQEPLSATVTQ